MLGILRRVFSFSDWAQHHPDRSPPGDMLDASFDAQNQRISELEQLVSRILRSDGALQNETVSWDSLTPEFRGFFEQTLKDATGKIVERVLSLTESAQRAGMVALEAQNRASSAQAHAELVQTAIDKAKSQAFDQIALLNDRSDRISALLEDAGEVRTDWDDASSSAQAWADSSRLWAEHMPDTLPDNALKVMDVTGDHWSSRWWANQAANAFGMLTSLYLGAHPAPPTTNNNGGPIEVGSIYYNTITGQPYVWTGSQWEAFYQPQRAAMMTLWYNAAAGQTAFPMSVADLHGSTYTMNPVQPESIDVHVNGLRRMPILAGYPGGSYQVNPANSTVTFSPPLALNDLVGIDVLVSPEALGPGEVLTWVLKPLVGQDGIKTVFNLATADASGPAVTTTKAEELLVSLDGVLQQPTVSYFALGAQITFAQAPAADSLVFITWLCPDGLGSGISTSGVPEAPLDGQPYMRRSAAWEVVNIDVGTY